MLSLPIYPVIISAVMVPLIRPASVWVLDTKWLTLRTSVRLVIGKRFIVDRAVVRMTKFELAMLVVFPEDSSNIINRATRRATLTRALAVRVTNIVVTARQTVALLRPNEQLAGTIRLIMDPRVFRCLTPTSTCGSIDLEEEAFNMTSSLLWTQ